MSDPLRLPEREKRFLGCVRIPLSAIYQMQVRMCVVLLLLWWKAPPRPQEHEKEGLGIGIRQLEHRLLCRDHVGPAAGQR